MDQLGWLFRIAALRAIPALDSLNHADLPFVVETTRLLALVKDIATLSKEARESGCSKSGRVTCECCESGCSKSGGVTCECHFCGIEKQMEKLKIQLNEREIKTFNSTKKRIYDKKYHMLPSGGAGRSALDYVVDDEQIYDVEKEAKKDEEVEELEKLREAAWGAASTEEDKKRYFETLAGWKWEYTEEDEEHIRMNHDKYIDAMLAFSTMLSPHVFDSTCPINLPKTKDGVNDYFKYAKRSCAAKYHANNDETRPLHSCGTCGIRDPRLEYTRMQLSDKHMTVFK